MRRFFTTVFLLWASFSYAQDITGVWQGHFRSNNVLSKRYFPDDERYKFEVQIAQDSRILRAVTYSYQSTVFYGKADANGTVNPKNGKVLLQELKITEMRMQGGSDACIMTCFLQYSKSGDDEFLEGTYVSMNVRDSSNCGKGSVFLRKSVSSDFYKEPFLVRKEKEEGEAVTREKNAPAHAKKPPPPHTAAIRPAAAPKTGLPKPARPANTPKPATPDPGPVASRAPKNIPGKSVAGNKPPPKKPGAQKTGVPAETAKRPPVRELPLPHPAVTDSSAGPIKLTQKAIPFPIPKVLTSRANELVQTITVSSTEVTLNIYDNGAIDNDTISVYLDKKLVVSNARLTEKPIVVKLHLDETEANHELVMVAENEGDSPPNTSLMVVKAGDKEYEVRIASSEQKNAVVVFKYEKTK